MNSLICKEVFELKMCITCKNTHTTGWNAPCQNCTDKSQYEPDYSLVEEKEGINESKV